MDIILDMGNVLLEWNKDKILQSVSNTKKDYLILDKSIFQSGLWERLDLGTMTREELVLKLVSMIGRGYQKKVEEVIWNWPSYIDIYREVFPVLSELKKKGHRIFVLSNTSKVFYDLLEEQLSPLKELLDGFVLSCDIKAIKPDLAMFKGILDKYQLDPTNCVFLDDIEDNTIAAEKLGIKSYQVKKRSDVVDILKSYI
ncbi:haloacid dehalogenase-like hydrolase [Streptococcus sp. CM6]|uniref:HAD family phosphatase n=1 Tax=Streptococcus halitosis TaxID=2172545 RepID=A0A426FY11_9STRE|nr:MULTISPECIES: HAD family phosphatase [Streptococcus]EUC80062.1 haloacid dehalogenase-like hydrolase [Streptococcus sp. SR1]EUC81403.1 haloacid dehalogenase-like hydrolase [Streptococcus sp. CM6]MCY7094197.1 HAD family phosphatase [Streptococcus oralis]NIB83953.1 HAD family phosphatase [Streptococcus sp. CCUG 71758]ORO36604.1 hydrolase [Streptococcus oralis subsp. tigurinus]